MTFASTQNTSRNCFETRATVPLRLLLLDLMVENAAGHVRAAHLRQPVARTREATRARIEHGDVEERVREQTEQHVAVRLIANNDAPGRVQPRSPLHPGRRHSGRTSTRRLRFVISTTVMDHIARVLDEAHRERNADAHEHQEHNKHARGCARHLCRRTVRVLGEIQHEADHTAGRSAQVEDDPEAAHALAACFDVRVTHDHEPLRRPEEARRHAYRDARGHERDERRESVDLHVEQRRRVHKVARGADDERRAHAHGRHERRRERATRGEACVDERVAREREARIVQAAREGRERVEEPRAAEADPREYVELRRHAGKWESGRRPEEMTECDINEWRSVEMYSTKLSLFLAKEC
uniref:Uncharacterized protein n=1 Tax=Globisporangium ultimum (strain ATCC 200006 / CBS 805.95 / DAOM BR144) TaxID=431595 RepID=K3X9U7_GLOUD